MTLELTVCPEILKACETCHSYSCSIRVPGAWLCEVPANQRTASQQGRGVRILPIPGNGRKVSLLLTVITAGQLSWDSFRRLLQWV